MHKKRLTSPIWTKVSSDELKKLVEESDSISKILRYFGLENKGGNYRTLRSRLDYEGIDYSSIKRGDGSNLGRKFPSNRKQPTEELLVENSIVNNSGFRRRLIKEDVLKNKCYSCGIEPFWNGTDLSLQLDHINGNNRDNRIENLRILCPNCHSQTETFAGKNNKKTNDELKTYTCKLCMIKISAGSTYCISCFRSNINNKSKEKCRKVKNRPSKEIILEQVNEIGYVGTGKLYGVSDNAVRKWLK